MKLERGGTSGRLEPSFGITSEIILLLFIRARWKIRLVLFKITKQVHAALQFLFTDNF